MCVCVYVFLYLHSISCGMSSQGPTGHKANERHAGRGEKGQLSSISCRVRNLTGSSARASRSCMHIVCLARGKFLLNEHHSGPDRLKRHCPQYCWWSRVLLHSHRLGLGTESQNEFDIYIYMLSQCSMYGIFTILGVTIGKYFIHRVNGEICITNLPNLQSLRPPAASTF